MIMLLCSWTFGFDGNQSYKKLLTYDCSLVLSLTKHATLQISIKKLAENEKALSFQPSLFDDRCSFSEPDGDGITHRGLRSDHS